MNDDLEMSVECFDIIIIIIYYSRTDRWKKMVPAFTFTSRSTVPNAFWKSQFVDLIKSLLPNLLLNGTADFHKSGNINLNKKEIGLTG